MSDTVEYTANSMRLYDIGGELYISVATKEGPHVRMSIGFAQALMMNQDTATFIANHFSRKEAAEVALFSP